MRATSPGYAGTEELEGSADLAQDASTTVTPTAGFKGLITFAHEDGPVDLDIRIRDATTIEKVHIAGVANFDTCPVVISSSRWAQAFNRTAGARFISYVAVMFT